MSKKSLHPLTEIINKKQKIKSNQLRNHAMRWLAATFPKAFDDTSFIHPLKIGIIDDILAQADAAAAAGISKSKLRNAVMMFTRKIDYLACLKAREMRIDLDGNPTVQVTEEEAAQAIEKIKKHIEKSAKLSKQSLDEKAASLGKPASPSSMRLTKESPTYSSDINYDSRFSVAHQAPRPASTVVIKHKATKTFDPSAVARLKEKLGLVKDA